MFVSAPMTSESTFTKRMSILNEVEEAVKWCKAEQAKIHVNIQLYKDILLSLTLQTQDASVGLGDADKGSEQGIVPQEKEEIELLEQALKKALWIRSSTGSKGPYSNHEPSRPNKEQGNAVVRPKDINQTSGTSKGKQATNRPTSSKTSSLENKVPRKPRNPALTSSGANSVPRLGQLKVKTCVKSVRAHSASSAKIVYPQVDKKTKRTLADCNPFNLDKAPTSASNTGVSCGEVGTTGPTSLLSSEEPVPVRHTGDAGTCSTPPQNRIPSDLIAKWKSLRVKQNRLWDNVMVIQSQTVPGRSAFMERMGTQFPKCWPCGSPDQTRVLVDSLTHKGRDLTHCYQVQKLLTQHASLLGTEPDHMEIKNGSELTLEQLEMIAEELRKYAVQVKQEWEAWDRWRPEGGCLCLVGEKGEPGDQAGAPLPPTITYTTEAELVELEKLRMKVALLQQEMYLHQALSDSLLPQLSPLLCGPGSPNCSVLRDVYSLLAEGGELFPALVLDNEPD